MKERLYCSILTIQRTNEIFPLSTVKRSKLEAQSTILVMEGKVGLKVLSELTRKFHPQRPELLDWGLQTVPLKEIK